MVSPNSIIRTQLYQELDRLQAKLFVNFLWRMFQWDTSRSRYYHCFIVEL